MPSACPLGRALFYAAAPDMRFWEPFGAQKAGRAGVPRPPRLTKNDIYIKIVSLLRGVAKFGYRTCFGSRGPQVQILSPRPSRRNKFHIACSDFFYSVLKSRKCAHFTVPPLPKTFFFEKRFGVPGLSLQVPYRLFRLFLFCIEKSEVRFVSASSALLTAAFVSCSKSCLSLAPLRLLFPKSFALQIFLGHHDFFGFLYALAAFVYNPCKNCLSRTPLLLLPKCFTAQNILVRPLVLAAVS